MKSNTEFEGIVERKVMPKRKTHEEFIEEMSRVNKDIKILGEYVNAKTHIECECLVDGYRWSATPDMLLSRTGCPKCHKVARRGTTSFVCDMAEINPNMKILGEYINNRTPIKTLCLKHNKIFYPTPDKLLIGQGCSECRKEKISNALSLSHNEFLKRVYAINSDITVLDSYISCRDEITVECNLCGKRWKAIPNNIFHKGITCSCLWGSLSKGEKKILEWLRSNEIKHFTQYTFDGLVGVKGGSLSYDFYLPKNNLLIEFQGEQHYKPCQIFGSDSKFEIQRIHDERKRQYAKLHNISLLEISYKDFKNIDSILQEKIFS